MRSRTATRRHALPRPGRRDMGVAPSRSGSAGGGAAAAAPVQSRAAMQAPPLRPSTSTSAASTALAPPNPAYPHPTHLVVLVHGIVGSHNNWRHITSSLSKLPAGDGQGFLVLPSSINSIERAGPRGTFEGIDVCGARVAAEVRSVVAEVQAVRKAAGAPPLERASICGHSMGGIVARFAAAHLLDDAASPPSSSSPAAATIAGLRPVAFVTIATPHAGCTGATSSAAAVPLVRWLRPPARLAAALDGPVAATMGRTGRQFFMRDGGKGNNTTDTTTPPLLVRMARDTPGDLPFLPALAAFPYRAAYANSSGDHLVGWANASLRYTDELPDLSRLPGGKGVILDTGLESGLSGGEDTATPVTPHRAGAAAEAAAPAGPGATRAEREEVVAILEGLRTLPWRRVDVCYKGAWHRGLAAHNLIQVTRSWCRWLDPEAGAAEAVCDGLVAVDVEVLKRERAGAKK